MSGVFEKLRHFVVKCFLEMINIQCHLLPSKIGSRPLARFSA